MKPSHSYLLEVRRQHAEAIITKHISTLFQRMPMLCGFSLRHNFEVADVTTHTWPGCTAGEDLYEDLLQGLTDLIEERPDAVQLLRGRTFARVLH